MNISLSETSPRNSGKCLFKTPTWLNAFAPSALRHYNRDCFVGLPTQSFDRLQNRKNPLDRSFISGGLCQGYGPSMAFAFSLRASLSSNGTVQFRMGTSPSFVLLDTNEQ